MSADVVEYSRLMATNQYATIRAVLAMRRAFHAIVRQCNGRLVDAVGDNLLAEFSRAAHALRFCSWAREWLDAQRRSGALELHLRFGVHTGDVLVGSSGMFGTAINVAARLQDLAAPDTVMASSSIFAGGASDIPRTSWTDHGEIQLRHIPGTISVLSLEPNQM